MTMQGLDFAGLLRGNWPTIQSAMNNRTEADKWHAQMHEWHAELASLLEQEYLNPEE